MCCLRAITACVFASAIHSGSAKADDPPVILAQTAPISAAAAGETEKATRVNQWTVGVAGGLLEGTFIRFAAEMSKALDDGENLRVIPLVTFGAAENVRDLLYLRGVDVSITHADVFDLYKRSGEARDIDRRVNYISELYIGELHIYARPEIKTLRDLEGKKVGFHTRGAGPTITGPILFERLKIKVEPVFINNTIAIEKMKTGEIAAILHTVGKPNDLFTKLKPEPGFHFINVEYGELFSDYYVPSTLTNEDYPHLIKADEKIETLGIPVILAVYNWPRGNDRFRRVQRFIEYYFTRFETLTKPPFHPKWREINLAARVPGWKRYFAAEEMLAKISKENPAKPSAGARKEFEAFIRERAAAGQSTKKGSEEEKRLFNEFLRWQSSRSKQN